MTGKNCIGNRKSKSDMLKYGWPKIMVRLAATSTPTSNPGV